MHSNPDPRLQDVGIYPVGSSAAAGEWQPANVAAGGMTELDELLIPLWTSHSNSRWLAGLR